LPVKPFASIERLLTPPVELIPTTVLFANRFCETTIVVAPSLLASRPMTLVWMMLLRIWLPEVVADVEMPAPSPLTAPWIVKPLITTLSASMMNAPSAPSTIDSSAPTRVRASTSNWAPWMVSDLSTVTVSVYVPGSARSTSPAVAAVTAS
jgi:hypothetical protein